MLHAVFLKGIAVPSKVFERFVEAHDLQIEFTGSPMGREEHKVLDQYFQEVRGIGGEIKVFIPEIPGLVSPPHVFVAFDWVFVLVARNVSNALQKPIPSGFSELCQEFGVVAEPSTFVLYSEGYGFRWIEVNPSLSVRYIAYYMKANWEVLRKGDLEADHEFDGMNGRW